MSIIGLAWKNIIKNPLNLVLSIILFSLGVGLISFLLIFNAQLKEKFDKNLAGIDLVIGAKGSPLQMILSSMYHIDNPTGNITIGEALPLMRPDHPLIDISIPLSLGDSYKSHRIVGTTPTLVELYNGKIAKGSIWQNDFEVSIGINVAERTGLKIGDTFFSAHGFEEDDMNSHDHVSFVVVGIFGPTGSVLDQLILCTPSTVWAVHDHEGTHDSLAIDRPDSHAPIMNNLDLVQYSDKEITSILVKYKNKTNFQALNFGRNINENTDLQAASPPIEMNRLYSMLGAGTDALNALAILIAIVSALSIFISLFKALKERKYALAIMRVLGARRHTLFIMVIVEGLIVAIIGFLAGTILCHVGIWWMANIMTDTYKYNFEPFIILPEEYKVMLASMMIGIFAAIVPAIQAAKTDINKTLSAK